MFCKEATKKDKTFKGFVVIELGKLASKGIVTNDAIKRVEEHLTGVVEELKRKKEAELRQFLITSDLKEAGSEILAGKPQIEYVEREEIKEAQEALKNKNKLLVVGKPGAGKSRFLLRILKNFNSYERFVLIRSFFREDGINSLDVELRKFESFILIWDDLHRVKNELVYNTLAQIEQLARDYGKKYIFIGASRMEGEYEKYCEDYRFKLKEIKLMDFRSLELIEKSSAYFGVSVEAVKDKLLEVGDGTPFYVISLFATSKERGKERLTVEDLKALPNASFEIWYYHLSFLEGEGRLSISEKNVLRSIALAMRAVPTIDLDTLEKFYEKIFRGDLSEFDYALKSIGKKFFIRIEGEFCSMHAVQAAVVDKTYPIEERKIERLMEVLTSLEKEKSLKLLWGFAYWSLRNKNHEDYLTFLNGFVEKEPNFAEAYYNRGLTYYELKQYEKAIEEYNTAIKLNSNYIEAYNNRGVVYLNLKQPEKAIEDHNKAIKLDPKHAKAYYNRGNAYLSLKQYRSAIEDYNQAIELNQNYRLAYANRGSAYFELKRYEKAIEDYSKVIELNPQDAEAYNNRGATYSESGQYKKAIRDYSKAIELNPNFALPYNLRGNAYGRLEQYEKAIEDCSKSIELDPSSAEAYNPRGIAYRRLNQHEKAIGDYSKAIELNPEYALTYYNRGIAYADLGWHEKAIEDYSKAIELNPKFDWYNNRGNAYYALNQYEKAIGDYSKAIDSFILGGWMTLLRVYPFALICEM